MDYYLNNQNCKDRLLIEWKQHGKIIIAVDYDDTLYDFHNKGRRYNDIINLLKRCRKIGCYIVIFTACGINQYNEINDYCNSNKIPYDKINDNMDFIKFTGRKIYYNILLDDRAGLQSAYECLEDVVSQMEADKIDKYYVNHAI